MSSLTRLTAWSIGASVLGISSPCSAVWWLLAALVGVGAVLTTAGPEFVARHGSSPSASRAVRVAIAALAAGVGSCLGWAILLGQGGRWCALVLLPGWFLLWWRPSGAEDAARVTPVRARVGQRSERIWLLVGLLAWPGLTLCAAKIAFSMAPKTVLETGPLLSAQGGGSIAIEVFEARAVPLYLPPGVDLLGDPDEAAAMGVRDLVSAQDLAEIFERQLHAAAEKAGGRSATPDQRPRWMGSGRWFEALAFAKVEALAIDDARYRLRFESGRSTAPRGWNFACPGATQGPGPWAPIRAVDELALSRSLCPTKYATPLVAALGAHPQLGARFEGSRSKQKSKTDDWFGWLDWARWSGWPGLAGLLGALLAAFWVSLRGGSAEPARASRPRRTLARLGPASIYLILYAGSVALAASAGLRPDSGLLGVGEWGGAVAQRAWELGWLDRVSRGEYAASAAVIVAGLCALGSLRTTQEAVRSRLASR